MPGGAARDGVVGGGAGAGPAGRGLGVAGLAGIAVSLVCFLLTALLGPSVFQPELPGPKGQPPFSLTAHPSPYLVIGLVAFGTVVGAAGLLACFLAVRRGWRVRAFPLVVVGMLVAAAFTFMPPVGSADHLNYASYGRMGATGHDPYTTTASDVADDPVIGAPEEWRHTPSVYGPVATAGQVVASWAGGDSVRLTVFVLGLENLLAFGLTGLILYRTARDRAGRLRSALMWTCNPLLLFHMVGGGHNDVLATAPMLAGLVLCTRTAGGPARAFLGGVLIGFGTAIKLPAALVGGGPAWTLLRRVRADGSARRSLAALVAGSVATVALAYVLAGPHSLDQVERASRMISLATPWHLVAVLHVPHLRTIVKIGWVVVMIVLVWALARVLPRPDGPDERQAEARAVAAALVLAWLLAAPYELPWYDAFGWAVLALLPWSRFDLLLLAHTTALSLAYLPARGPDPARLPDDLHWLISVVRSGVIPVLLTALLAWALWTGLRARPRRRRPAP
ncbi:polyprenol phosphomannose-dependent alpha 1,6 mannosyltransferase MptB [Actinomadura oligospora]|uniref:polyprenol phosphomannose-dependent alpha 1,6 mannosyltransferase MptB n=1 Tax=Actinomadura oligospora TaxID=111804 RepID=UPI0012FC3923|nr:polyprenol phosphomannose-dependent alpha 1,6 mannosyltransferase MptB [Actinomadura oligospora]